MVGPRSLFGRLGWAALVMGLCARAAAAAGPAKVAGPVAADAPVVEVLTMTPGPALFERFGHTALRVGERVYNFGTFNGDDPHLVRRFLGHTLPYWLSEDTVEGHYARYANRTITAQALALDEGEARALAARLEENSRPENRAYLYDFFLDNCATRVRDAVDRAAGGALAASVSVSGQAGRATYRGHVEHVLAGAPFLARGVSLLLSGFADRPITRWDDAFLPSELQAILAGARRADGRALVARTSVWVGPQAPRASRGLGRARGAEAMAGGVVLLPAAVAAALRRRAARAKRLLATASLVGFGLVGGGLGLAVLVSALTPYACSRGNANLLLLHPGLLALVPLGLLALGGRAVAATRLLLLASAAQVAGDLVLHAVGVAHQAHLALASVVLVTELLLLVALGGLPVRTAKAG